MAGNQVHDTLRGTEAREIAGTVQRVEPRICDVGGIPDVMQPRRSDQSFALSVRDAAARSALPATPCTCAHRRGSASARRLPRRLPGPARRHHAASLRSTQAATEHAPAHALPN